MLSLFLPRRCLHCEEGFSVSRKDSPAITSTLAHYFCSRCLRQIEAMEPPNKEDLRFSMNRFIDRDLYSDIIVRFPFRTQIQSLVHHFKYEDMPRLAIGVGRSIAYQIVEKPSKIDLIIPVPLHRTKRVERGYNQAELLAKGLAAEWKAPILAHKMVKRVRPTKTQTTLSVEERIENVQGAFTISDEATKHVTGQRVLILDDVMTTGSTMASLAHALLSAKPKSISFLTLAAAQLEGHLL